MRHSGFLLICVVAIVCQPTFAQSGAANDPRAIFESAQKALLAGQYSAAEAGFRAVLKLDPHSAAAYSNLGVVYMRTNRLAEAVRSLNEASRLAPKVTGIYLNLGLAYYRLQDCRSAVPHFDRVLAAQPDNYQARYLGGVCRFLNDDFAGAVERLAPFWDEEKNNLDYLFILGVAYGTLNRAAEEAEAFNQLVRVGGDSPHLHLLLGKAYLDLYNEPKAREELEKAVAADPKLPFAHYNLGILYNRLKMTTEAIREFELETAVSPRLPWAFEEIGNIYLKQEKLDAARGMFSQALRMDPHLAGSLAGLGKICVERGELQKGIAYLEQAVELSPETPHFHYVLGRAYIRAGRNSDGERHLKETASLQQKVHAQQRQRTLGDADPMAQPAQGRLPAPLVPASRQQ